MFDAPEDVFDAVGAPAEVGGVPAVEGLFPVGEEGGVVGGAPAAGDGIAEKVEVDAAGFGLGEELLVGEAGVGVGARGRLIGGVYDCSVEGYVKGCVYDCSVEGYVKDCVYDCSVKDLLTTVLEEGHVGKAGDEQEVKKQVQFAWVV